ncbi:MAG: hypothetical protein ACLP9L_05830 [Thermoguttaceae bacterium]
MVDTFAVVSGLLATVTLSEKVETGRPREFTASNAIVAGTPRSAMWGATNTNCVAELEPPLESYDNEGVATATEDKPGTPLNNERTSSGSRRS